MATQINWSERDWLHLMVTRVRARIETEIEVTPDLLGQWFADLDDDGQARFFVAAAARAASWKGDWMGQFYAAGSHLRNCACGTEDARDLVRSLAWGVENGKHG